MNEMHAAPHGLLDYIIVALAIGVLALTLYLCIRYLLKPGETEEDHIKKKILDEESRRDRKAKP
jgi:hypothetical protein